MSIDLVLDEPLYSGSSTIANMPAEGFVAIAGHIFEIDPQQYQRDTVPVLRTATNTNPESGESSLNDQGLWHRVQRDWRLGAGQKHLDETDSDRTRFFASKGIDPWTPRELALLHDTAHKTAGTGGTYGKVRDYGNKLLCVDGDTTRWTSAPTPTAPTWSTATAAGEIRSVAFDGSYAYYAFALGLALQRQPLGGGVCVNFGAFAAEVVGYGNGRLLAAAGARIVELSSTGSYGGAGQLDWTHPNAHFVWRGFFSTPAGIYAYGDADGMSEIMFITVGSTGALNPPVTAWRGLPNETVLCADSYGNLVAIGTSLGLRLATVATGNGSLTNGAQLLVPGGVTDMAFEGSYLWFTWTNYDGVSTGLGRANLARMVDSTNLVPAFASDLMATAQGTVTSVASFGGRRYFMVAGSGLWGEILNLVSVGTLDPGWISYGTVERKVGVSVDLRHKPLAGSVDISFVADVDVDEGGTTIGISSSVLSGTTGPTTPFGINSIPFEQGKMLFTLYRSGSDQTAGPVLRWWMLRSLPSPASVDEIIVPIRMFSRAETTRPFATVGEAFFSRLAEFRFLKGLEAAGTIVRYQEGSASYSVLIRGVQVRPRRISEDGEWFEAIVGVHLITLVGTQ